MRGAEGFCSNSTPGIICRTRRPAGHFVLPLLGMRGFYVRVLICEYFEKGLGVLGLGFSLNPKP